MVTRVKLLIPFSPDWLREQMRPKRLALWFGVAVLVLFFVYEIRQSVVFTVDRVESTYSNTEAPLLENKDFPAFYAGFSQVTSSNRGDLYDQDAMVRRILEVQGYEDIHIPQEIDLDALEFQWLR